MQETRPADGGPPEGLPMHLTAIGEVRSDIRETMLDARHGDLPPEEQRERIRAYHDKVRENIARVVVFPRWTELLDGIEGFSHILVLYWPHRIDPERRNLAKVHPMGRKDLPRVGIFATCSPARPNPVLVTAVPLLARDGSELTVKGLEAVDGSPVLDLKPYVRSYYGAVDPRVPEWMHRIHRELGIDIG